MQGITRMSIARLGHAGALCLTALCSLSISAAAFAQKVEAVPGSIIYKVQGANDRLEMTVNSSRLLTLDKDIPQAQVSNKDILTVTPMGPRQVQIHANKPGVTEVNLW